MSFTQVPSLVSFSPLTTILSADVNANYASLRNAFNALVTGSDTLAPFTVSGGAATFASGIYVSGGTIKVSGTTVSGVMSFSSGFAISGGVVSGNATFSSGINVGAVTVSATSATISGAPTFASGWTISAGGMNVSAGTFSGVAVFTSGLKTSAVADLSGGIVTVSGSTVTNAAIAFASGASGPTGIFQTPGGSDISFAVNGQNVFNINNATNVKVQSTLPLVLASAAGIATSTVVTSATLGYIFITAMAGTGTGVPTAIGGGVALAYDSTNNRLQVYNGAWRSVAVT